MLQRTFQLWGANLLGLSVLGLLIHSPTLAMLGLMAAFGGGDPSIRSLAELLTNVLNLVLQGAVAYSVLERLGGARPGPGDVLGTGLSRLGEVFGAVLVAGLAILAGCLCLILPGIVLATRLWVTVPVAVIESPGASGALKRSEQLTVGSRWPIFACMMVLGIIHPGRHRRDHHCRKGGGPRSGRKVTRWGASTTELTAGAQVVVILLSVPFFALGAVGPAVAYHDLRVGREGIPLAELLEVFE